MQPLDDLALGVRRAFWSFVASCSLCLLASLVPFEPFGIGLWDVPFAEDPGTWRTMLILGWTMTYLVCAVTLFRWLYAAHANLRRGGMGRLDWSPGWAVGGYFLPVAGLFVPYMVMKELWLGSSSLASGIRTYDRKARAPGLMNWWWGLFLTSSGLSIRALEMDNATLGYTMYMFGLILEGATAVLVIRLVGAVTSLQNQATQVIRDGASTGSSS